MKIARILLVFTLVLFSLTSFGQSIDKVYSKLNKLYEKQQFDKCKKKALSLKSKYPKSLSTYYFLSKIEIQYFKQFTNTPSTKQYKHLKSAANYSKRFKGEYGEWTNEIKNIYKAYILSWNDTEYKSIHVKKAVYGYYKTFKEQLPSYKYYYPNAKKEEIAVDLLDITKSNELRTKLITYASKLVGIPYFYSGEKPETGFDCSGFVLHVYKQIGINLPHNAHLQSQLPGETLSLDEAKPGDLIFFGSRSGNKWKTQHAGIFYANDNGETKVIHCVSRGVTIDGNNSSWDSYWKEKVLFVKRLPELQPEKNDK